MPSAAPTAAPREGLMIGLECRVTPEEDMFLAICGKLGVSDQGHTADEALHNLLISISLFLEESERQGELERILSDRGIWFSRLKADKPLPQRMDAAHVMAEMPARWASAVQMASAPEDVYIPAYLWKHSGPKANPV